MISLKNHPHLSRRQFLRSTSLGVSATAILSPVTKNFGAASTRSLPLPPIVVFSKVYQTLRLNFKDSAALTAEAGLNGVDAAVRSKGEVEPERVEQDLPAYVAALKAVGLSMPMITTGITGIDSPHAEKVLKCARAAGVKFYRVGFIERDPGDSEEKQLAENNARLKDLAALNKSVGIVGMAQNHSPAGREFLGGNLKALLRLTDGLDISHFGVAFDIGHAIIVHKDAWRPLFEKLAPRLKVAYVKDAQPNGRWVPFGEGEIGRSGYFARLKEFRYQHPISMHMEYNWSAGKEKTREALLKGLKESLGKVKEWWG
jgi:sugar phosphate isomerase/epimerase